MKAVTGELVSRDIGAELAAFRGLGDEIANDLAKGRLRSCNVPISMNERCEFAVVPARLMGQERVSLEHRRELLMYMTTFSSMADVAADPNASRDFVRNASPVLHAALALVLLAAATVLAVYKPQGMTPYGQRRQRERREQERSPRRTAIRSRPRSAPARRGAAA